MADGREEKGRMSGYYIPHKDASFDVWIKQLVHYVVKKTGGIPAEWTHIPLAAVALLTDGCAVWDAAYAKTLGPHTAVDTEFKNETKRAVIKSVQPFVNQYLRFPPVTDVDRVAMGVPNHDTHLTSRKPPETAPFFYLFQAGPGALGIVYWDGMMGKKGSKPKGVEAARIYYGVSDTPVTDPDRLPRSVRATKCPHIIRFTEAERGMRVFVALKWELRKEHGESPWSEVLNERAP
jgi:hypothetical protein